MASVPIHTCVMGVRIAAAWHTLGTFIKQRETSVAVFVVFFSFTGVWKRDRSKRFFISKPDGCCLMHLISTSFLRYSDSENEPSDKNNTTGRTNRHSSRNNNQHSLTSLSILITLLVKSNMVIKGLLTN